MADAPLTWGCRQALVRLLERRHNPFLRPRARCLQERGLIESVGGRWRLTPAGRELAREARR